MVLPTPPSITLPPEDRLELLRAELETSGRLNLTIRGNCMHPWALNGDSILVRPLTQSPPVGEVVVFFEAAELFAHRVVRYDEQGRVVTRGDLSARPDRARPWQDLLGRVSEVNNRYAGRLDPSSPTVIRVLPLARVVFGTLVETRRLLGRFERWRSARR
ncbi:MAG: S24/S26 family peptidase [Myxococcales bacterium]|nr:S24/S26 family peptidase [Myxococcales bacterium]